MTAAVAAGRLAREGCGRSGVACGGADKDVWQGRFWQKVSELWPAIACPPRSGLLA